MEGYALSAIVPGFECELTNINPVLLDWRRKKWLFERCDQGVCSHSAGEPLVFHFAVIVGCVKLTATGAIRCCVPVFSNWRQRRRTTTTHGPRHDFRIQGYYRLPGRYPDPRFILFTVAISPDSWYIAGTDFAVVPDPLSEDQLAYVRLIPLL